MPLRPGHASGPWTMPSLTRPSRVLHLRSSLPVAGRSSTVCPRPSRGHLLPRAPFPPRLTRPTPNPFKSSPRLGPQAMPLTGVFGQVPPPLDSDPWLRPHPFFASLTSDLAPVLALPSAAETPPPACSWLGSPTAPSAPPDWHHKTVCILFRSRREGMNQTWSTWT